MRGGKNENVIHFCSRVPDVCSSRNGSSEICRFMMKRIFSSFYFITTHKSEVSWCVAFARDAVVMRFDKQTEKSSYTWWCLLVSPRGSIIPTHAQPASCISLSAVLSDLNEICLDASASLLIVKSSVGCVYGGTGTSSHYTIINN